MMLGAIGSDFRNWMHNFQWKYVWSKGTEGIGNVWVVMQVIVFFTALDNQWFTEKWYLFLALIVLWVGYACRPKNAYRFALNGRDTIIELRAGDVFRMKGDLIVPVNTLFDNDLQGNILQTNSVQRQLIKQYYDDDSSDLDLDVQQALTAQPYTETVDHPLLGQKNQYEVGTTISLNKHEKKFYLLALTNVNEQGRANGTVEDLRSALPALWYYISEHGSKGDLVIPLVGTSSARIPTKREEVFKIIVRSFIASCASKGYCDKLTIVIYRPDIVNHNINLQALGKFLESACMCTDFEAY